MRSRFAHTSGSRQPVFSRACALQFKIQHPKLKMLYLAIVISVAASSWSVASAESLHDRIQRANGLLKQGETGKALDSYNEIKVDHPDSPVLEYNIGCAEYEQQLKDLQANAKKAKPDFSQAIQSFEQAMQSKSPEVSESAAYNRATALAQTAKALEEPKEQPSPSVTAPGTRKDIDPHQTQGPIEANSTEREKAFRDAINAYQDVLAKDPGNVSAQHNIDHLRYTMKKGTPPPPPSQGGEDQQEQDQGGTGQNQEQQPKQDPSKEQSDQQPQDQPQQQDNEQKDQEQSSQPNKPEPNENSEGQQSETQPDSGEMQEEPQENREDAGTPPPDLQSVEALLQSLEAQDKEMQKELRKGDRTTRVRSTGWW
ncbi:MAG: hypothetical protein IT366_24365 [Candidatus Hydrogenedentes bacterium]|nr:hypothetical protein [Candidatus Hydrogenedentota bacterium]